MIQQRAVSGSQKTRSTNDRGVRRTTALLCGTIALIGSGLLAACAEEARGASRSRHGKKIDRGAYLVTIAGCHDCHTPFAMGPNGPEPDMTRALSGHPASIKITTPAPLDETWEWAGTATNTAFAGPWGVSFSANLTPDRQTGIGIWTEEQFIETIRSGRHWGVDRPILPPMPWPMYAHMTDEDLGAVYAYLQTVRAIRNPVPRPLPPSNPEATQAASHGAS